MSNYPQITLQNNLSAPVTLFDAFNNNSGDKSIANYFGTLTGVGDVGSGKSQSFTPINGPISTYIIYDNQNQPVKRVFTLGQEAASFTVDQADVDVITSTQEFVKLLGTNPDDPTVKSFNALIKNGQANAAAVNAFFAGTENYKTCTYISYMLVVVALARTPATRNLPPAQQAYSLSTLLSYMGITWPSEMPDVVISDFYCSESADIIQLGGQLNIRDVTFDDGVLDRVISILPSETFRFQVIIDLQAGLGFGNIQLTCLFEDLTIPLGDLPPIKLQRPTAILSIAPLFKFVVFEIKATLPFKLFNNPPFNAIAAMTIDNIEAEVGVTLDGAGNTLLTPPGIKGLHLDQFGVGMGVFFEPPGFALGVEGKFHIGEGSQSVQLDDDQFAIVCALEGDVPNPLYLSFYVPQLSLDQVITLFTDQSFNLDFPVNFTDLSFHWAENPMEPVTLPDGSLAPMGYGFSAAMDLFGLDFYADLAIDLNNGIQGKAQLSPFSLGPVFALTGNGAGVTINVDANGNPVPNNVVPKTTAERKAIETASTKKLVPPGGAELQISTSASPYFELDAKLSFLGFDNSIDAVIDKNGISFKLDYGSIISGKMDCVLKDYHNFSGKFSYGPNYHISLPSIAGLSLGTLQLTAEILTELGLTTSSNDVTFTAGGGFDFEGLTCTIGPFNLDINISGLSDVLDAIGKWIEDHVEDLFGALITDVEKWAKAVYTNVIVPVVEGAEYVVNVFKNVFGKTVDEVGDLLKGSAYALEDVAGAMKSLYGAVADDVARALQTAYDAAQEAVAQTLRDVGYAADEVAGALSTVYGATAQVVATVMQSIGYAAEETASALESVFGMVPNAINDVMQAAGYAVSDIEDAFKSIGGAFASFAESTWDTVTHYINPSNW